MKTKINKLSIVLAGVVLAGFSVYQAKADYIANTPSTGPDMITNDLRGDGYAGQLEISTAYGWIHLGPKTPGYCHIDTDRNSFYFNRKIALSDGVIRAYNGQNPADGKLLFEVGAGSTVNTYITAMNIQDITGNVGIGEMVTDPQAKLVVDGEVLVHPGGGLSMGAFTNGPKPLQLRLRNRLDVFFNLDLNYLTDLP